MDCPPQLSSQNWVQVGDLNDTPRVFFNDTISGLLYISGNFRFNGTDTLDGICTFDGDNFTALGRRFDCAGFGCNPGLLIARYDDHIYFSVPGLTLIDNIAVQGIARWDGTQWEPAMPGVENGIEKPYLDGYYIHQGLFYSVGSFRTAEGDTCNSVAYWDGQKWTGLGFIPYPDNGLPRVSRVVFYKDQLYVAGQFSWEVSGGQDIARLTNQGWELVGGGLHGGLANVFDMEVYKGELYICGYFSKWDGNVGNKIMRWDGQEWHEVGNGFCSPNITATEMMVHNGKLYVVGNFDCVENDIPASKIAVWDGERWCNLGNSYFNNTISCIAAYKDEIYVGGGFTEVGGQPCRSLAKWVGDESSIICSDPVSSAFEAETNNLKLWPNPARETLHIQCKEGKTEDIHIFDVLGREMPGLAPEIMDGEIRLKLEGVPAGLYWVTLRMEGRIWSGKFVKA